MLGGGLLIFVDQILRQRILGAEHGAEQRYQQEKQQDHSAQNGYLAPGKAPKYGFEHTLFPPSLNRT